MKMGTMSLSGLSSGFARVCTHLLSAPVFALIAIAFLALTRGRELPGNLYWAGVMIICLSLFPWLTSPECPFLPVKDRRTRRVISFAGCIAGYAGAVAFAFIGGAPPLFMALACSYLGTAVALAAVNTFYRASGHASGVAGPVTALLLTFRTAALPALAVIPLVMWARLKVKGHTLGQTIVGALLAAAATWVSFRMVM